MRWKNKAADASILEGTERTVFLAMLLMSDWRGRLIASEMEIAKKAGISDRQLRRIMPSLYLSGEVYCHIRGTGRSTSSYRLKRMVEGGHAGCPHYDGLERTF